MKLKHWIRFIAIMLGLWLLTYVMWSAITLAEWNELESKKHYLESLRAESESFNKLIQAKDREIEQAKKDKAYYEEKKLYVDATIEVVEWEIAWVLGLKLQR